MRKGVRGDIKSMEEYQKILIKLDNAKQILEANNLSDININLLDEILTDINIYKEKNINKKIYIPVMGSMKSGKSTFLNALLGNDIMPSENEACTIAPIYIKLKNKSSDYILKQNNNGKVETLLGEDIREVFLQDVRKYRKDIKNNTIDIKSGIQNYLFESNMNSIKNKTNFEIYFIDCPGINELLFSNKLKKYMEDQINRIIQISDYIVYVLDIQYFKNEENKMLLENIVEKNENVLFVLNKIDLVKNNDNMKEIVNDIYMSLENIGFKNPKIFCTSSILALISRKIINNTISDLEMDNYFKEYIQGKYIQNEVEINGEKLYKIPSYLDLSKILLENSNIYKVEDYIQQILNNLESNKHKRYDKQIYKFDKKLNGIFESIIYNLNNKISEQIENFNQNNSVIDVENIRFNKKYKFDLIDLNKDKLQKIIESKEQSFSIEDWERDCRNMRCLSISMEFDRNDFNSMNRFCEDLRESFRSNTRKYFQPLENELFNIRKELIDKYMNEINSKLPQILYDIVDKEISKKCKEFNIKNEFFISKFKFYPENLRTIMLSPGLMEVVIDRDFKRYTVKVKLSKSDISEYGERGLQRKKELENIVANELVYIFRSQLGTKIDLYFNEHYDKVLNSIKQKLKNQNENKIKNRNDILRELNNLEEIISIYLENTINNNLDNSNIVKLRDGILNKKLSIYTDNKKIEYLNNHNLTVVFNQKELNKYLDKNIYKKNISVALCGESFEIDENRQDIKYIGVNFPTIFINSTSRIIDFYKNNINFENIILSSHDNIIIKNKNLDNVKVDKLKIKVKKDMNITYCKTFVNSESDFLDNWIFIDSNGKVHYKYNGTHLYSQNLTDIKYCNKKIVDLDVSKYNIICVSEEGEVEFIRSTFTGYYDSEMIESTSSKIKQASLIYQDMAILLDDEGKVYYYGVEGEFDYINRQDKNQTFSLPNFNSKIIQIDSKQNVILALDERGKVYVWGIKNDENKSVFDVPKNLPFIVKAKVYKDGSYILALDEFGKLHGWGSDCIENISKEEFDKRRADTFDDENTDFVEVKENVEFLDLGAGDTALDAYGNMYVFLDHSCKYAYKYLSNKKKVKKLMCYIRICEDNSLAYNNLDYNVMLPKY